MCNKQSERDSKDTDATNSCPRKVQVKTTLCSKKKHDRIFDDKLK